MFSDHQASFVEGDQPICIPKMGSQGTLRDSEKGSIPEITVGAYQYRLTDKTKK